MDFHITLIGRQPAPVYHGIVATQPDKVILAYSNDMLPSSLSSHTDYRCPSSKAKEILSTNQELADQCLCNINSKTFLMYQIIILNN